MFALEPLALDAPVYVTHDEASAYARWKGARLPTEAEWHRRVGGIGGEELPPTRATSTSHWDPSGGSRAKRLRRHDLAGHGWEWTSTLFAPFPGFAPMASYPEYSADFFDDAHYVLKGASPVTPRELVRPSFRNWFRPAYPYVYATFRCAR